MNTKVINFIGGPGIGKTTMACLLFSHMKMEGFVCEYVSEFAKNLVWQKDYEHLNNQYYVSCQQIKKLTALKGHVEYIITDSPIFLGLYYQRYCCKTMSFRAWI